MEQKNNNYELSFWFSSQLEEKAVEQKFDNLLKQLEKSGASILFSQSPQLKQLAYPIKKERNAYFGYIQFEFSKDSLAHLEEGLRLNNGVIRFMISNIKAKEKEEKVSRPTFRKSVFKEKEKISPTKVAEDKKEEKVISLEELDKKLSEILKEE